MSRRFDLAALLRLRTIQKDAAVARHVDADTRRRETLARRTRAMGALADSPIAPEDSDTLYAIAAARASTRSMLASLDARLQRDEQAVAVAAAEVRETHTRQSALEKLEERHVAAVTAEELRAEQVALDELTGRAWHRDRQDGARRGETR